MSDLFRFSRDQTPEALRHLLQKGKEVGAEGWPGLDHMEMGAYISNLLSSQLANHKPPDATMVNHMIPEVVKRMMAEDSLRMVSIPYDSTVPKDDIKEI